MRDVSQICSMIFHCETDIVASINYDYKDLFLIFDATIRILDRITSSFIHQIHYENLQMTVLLTWIRKIHRVDKNLGSFIKITQ